MAKVTRSKGNSRIPYLLAGLVLLLLLAFAVISLSQPNPPAVADVPPEISVDVAAQKYEDGVFFLDVREPHEWEEVHIPGAVLVPLAQLESRLSELPRDQEIVVVCRSGNRSATARDILRNAGFEQVSSMAGGMNEWAKSGYPTESAENN